MAGLVAVPVVSLRPRKAQPFFNRHPWVFAGAIAKVAGNPQAGDEVVVKSHEGKFVGRGLFNPVSKIRVRLYSWNEEEALNDEFWSEKIGNAIQLRERHVVRPSTDSYRVVFSESDGVSGLTVDRYGEWLMVQLTSLALSLRRECLFDVLAERLKPKGIWLRTEKGIAEAEGLELMDGLVRGVEPPRPMTIQENGLRFGVDLAEGQKTGAFLDQRDNRRAAAAYCQGAKMLDLFSYCGGFGVTAAALGGAASVTCVDSSQPALDAGLRNAEVNAVADRMTFVRSDAFKFLEEAISRSEQFDVVVLDPPKMARRQAGIEQALRGYHSLNVLAASVLKPGGILVTCSCSGRVSRSDFEMMLAQTGTSIRRSIKVLETRGPAADHPTSPNCPESDYLKCFICAID